MSIQQHAQNKIRTLCTMLKRKKCEINALGLDKRRPTAGPTHAPCLNSEDFDRLEHYG